MSNIPEHLISILEDLYQANPELRAHESDLIPLIQDLLAVRPNVEPSAAFSANLRQTILAAHAKRYATPDPSPSIMNRFFSSFNLKQLALPIGGLAVVALAITTIPTLRNYSFNTQTNTNTPSAFIQPTSELATSGRLSDGAFGLLALGGSARSQSGGGGMGGFPQAAVSSDSAVANYAVGSDMKMIAPGEFTNYTYTYDGELPTWEPKLDVYKRTKGMSQSASLIAGLKQTTQSIVNIDALNGLELQSFTLNQNQPYGYTISVDLMESMVNFNQNYSQWPHPEANCQDEACYQRLRLQIDDIPSNEAVIAIADAFMKQQGINLSAYGPAVLTNNWRTYYDLASNKADYYIPDSLSVTYPLLVDGKTAYDEGGTPYGLNVNVNLRQGKVDNVWNMTNNTFQKSAYEAETDQTRIRSIAEKGGIYGYSYPGATKTVKIALEAPELTLQKVHVSRAPGQSADELLVPALRFRVKDRTENSYAPEYISIPLVKQILDQQNNDRPEIMPMAR